MSEAIKFRPEVITKAQKKDSVQVIGKDGSRALASRGEVQALDTLKGMLPTSADVFTLKVGGMTTSADVAGKGTVNLPTWCGN